MSGSGPWLQVSPGLDTLLAEIHRRTEAIEDSRLALEAARETFDRLYDAYCAEANVIASLRGKARTLFCEEHMPIRPGVSDPRRDCP